MVSIYTIYNILFLTIIGKSNEMLSMDNQKVMSEGRGGENHFYNSQKFRKIKNIKDKILDYRQKIEIIIDCLIYRSDSQEIYDSSTKTKFVQDNK